MIILIHFDYLNYNVKKKTPVAVEEAEDLNVVIVPFRWYKAFEIFCKGASLIELSKQLLGIQKMKKLKQNVKF